MSATKLVRRFTIVTLSVLLGGGMLSAVNAQRFEMDYERVTPLERAVFEGDLERVRAELAQGADPNQVGGITENLLFAATVSEDLEIAEALLVAGAKIGTETDPIGMRPIDAAVSQLPNTTMFNLLVSTSDEMIIDKRESDFFGIASSLISYDLAESLALYIPKATDLDFGPDAAKQTALMKAVMRNKKEIVATMLASGADCHLDATDFMGRTAFDLAESSEMRALIMSHAN